MRWPRYLQWLCGEVGVWPRRVEEEGLGDIARCFWVEFPLRAWCWVLEHMIVLYLYNCTLVGILGRLRQQTLNSRQSCGAPCERGELECPGRQILSIPDSSRSFELRVLRRVTPHVPSVSTSLNGLRIRSASLSSNSVK